jgi:hypothetical protein
MLLIEVFLQGRSAAVNKANTVVFLKETFMVSRLYK